MYKTLPHERCELWISAETDNQDNLVSQKNTTNPIRAMRAEMARLDFAVKTGLSYYALNMLEKGVTKKLSEATLDRLEAFSGIPSATIQEKYTTWRRQYMASNAKKSK